VINVSGLHVKCTLFLSDFEEIPPQIFEKDLNIKFREYPPSRSQVIPCWQTDMTKLLVAFFCNFANAHKNRYHLIINGYKLVITDKATWDETQDILKST
jgi:hypothetical protein